MKDKNFVIIDCPRSSKPDYLEGLDEKAKLMTKEAQETLKKEGELYFGKPPQGYD